MPINLKSKRLVFAALLCLVASVFGPAQSDLSRFPPQVVFTADGDHRNMMEQLGIRTLRPGADPKNQDVFDEADANQYPLPEMLITKSGKRVTTVGEWTVRRAEIAENFEREVYGRIPANAPKVNWEVTNRTRSEIGGIPTITKSLIGRVDNSSYPLLEVNNYLTDPMPPVGQLIGGELAWRQHEGGHSVAENWPSFIEWVGQFIKGRRLKTKAMEVSPLYTEQDEDAAIRPVPRPDRNSMLAHERLLEKAKKGRIDVYFLGDSITRRWGASDKQYRSFLENWRQNFFGWNAANFGWGGDTTQNILWRIQNGELDHVNPKVIILMAGTNNVGSTPASHPDDPRIGQVTRGIKAILEVCRSKAPKATIVLMGITPRNDNMTVMPIIDRINENIARLADVRKIRYLNINDRLADKEGRLFEGMATDGLHLDVKGYQVWADALKPILKELLGPPAKEDHAPPPTGDPSAQD